MITALRIIVRNKLYSFINIAGLAVALAATILILLFVRFEYSYNKWIPGAASVYRLQSTIHFPGQPADEIVMTSGTIRDLFAKSFAGEVLAVSRYDVHSRTVRVGDRVFNDRVSWVDGSFFELFDLPAALGKRQDGLKDTNSILISEAIADKYFGTDNPLGQQLILNDQWSYTVAGVLKNLPDNSSIEADLVALIDISRVDYIENWGAFNLQTWVKLSPGADPAAIEARLAGFIDNFFPNTFFGLPADAAVSDSFEIRLMALSDLYLYSKARGDDGPVGSIAIVLAFLAIAGLILAIAAINYTNLATARASVRMREIGLRKVMGASRRQLVVQLLGESIVIVTLALISAFLLVELVLPFYADFLQKDIAFDLFGDATLLATGIGAAVAVGVIGGLYPAFYLSGFRPARVLGSNRSLSSGSGRFRNALVILQFAISIALIVVTTVVYQQTLFARTMERGFEVSQKLVLAGLRTAPVRPQIEALRLSMAAIPGVGGVATMGDVPPYRFRNSSNLIFDDQGVRRSMPFDNNTVDYNFFEFFEIQALAGRLFSREFPGDEYVPFDENNIRDVAIVLNRAAARTMGFVRPEDAVGQSVGFGQGRRKANIIGVIENLHERSARIEIAPTFYILAPDRAFFMVLDVSSRNMAATLAAIDRTWSGVVPNAPIRRSFVEEDFDVLYEAEIRMTKMFMAFAVFAVFVASLGLFGLASFAAERRTREIGIRKVLGAGVPDIVRLLVWQFTRPVLIANLIAWPSAWYFASDWLEGFSYRIDLGPLPFALAAVGAIIVAWVTVGAYAFRVARANPIGALHYE